MELLEYLKKRNGNLSYKDARKNGFYDKQLYRFSLNQNLQLIDKGFYLDAKSSLDALYYYQHRFSKGIYSHETTLDFYQLSTNMPKHTHMTFPYGYNVDRTFFKENYITPHFVSKNVYELGIIVNASYESNPITCYDMERTLCDIWNPQFTFDNEMKINALKDYMQHPDKNLNKLMGYMRHLSVSNEMRSYLTVLL